MTQRKKQSREPSETGEAIPELEAEIDRTRGEISDDLRTLGEKLSPENLKQEAKEVVHEAKAAAVETLHEAKDVATTTFREVKDTAMEAVHEKVNDLRDGVRRVERRSLSFLRENAVPLTLIGVGAAWLFSRNRNGRFAEPPPRYLAQGGEGEARHRLGQVKERARDFTEHEIDQVRNAARGAQQRVGEATERARDVAGRELRAVRDRSLRISEENPLAIGLVAAAAGVGVGLLLPGTRRESELMGEKREELLGEAKHVLEDLGQTARETVRDVKGSISGSAE